MAVRLGEFAETGGRWRVHCRRQALGVCRDGGLKSSRSPCSWLFGQIQDEEDAVLHAV